MERTIKSQDAVAGRILWLPPFDEVPENAVKRVRGKGAVEKGLFNHPVVVCSRPTNNGGAVVHFHLITSFGGKTLSEMYGKNSDYCRSRRLGYLPISPAPEHPDGLPSLVLGAGATMRWDSYVNVVDIYEIRLDYLWMFANPETPRTTDYHLGKKSVRTLRQRAETLTKYIIDVQFPAASFPPMTFGLKNIRSNRIATGELEDLKIKHGLVDDLEPSTIRIPKVHRPVTEAAATSQNTQKLASFGEIPVVQNTKPAVVHREEFNLRLGNQVQEVESTVLWKQSYNPQRSEPIAAVVPESNQRVMPNVVGSKDGRDAHMKTWFDNYVSMVAVGFKKVAGFARWVIKYPLGCFPERDDSPV